MNLTMIIIEINILFLLLLYNVVNVKSNCVSKKEEKSIISDKTIYELLSNLLEKSFLECPLPYKMEVNSKSLIVWKDMDMQHNVKNIKYYYFNDLGIRDLSENELYSANRVLYEFFNNRYKDLYKFTNNDNAYEIVFDGF